MARPRLSAESAGVAAAIALVGRTGFATHGPRPGVARRPTLARASIAPFTAAAAATAPSSISRAAMTLPVGPAVVVEIGQRHARDRSPEEPLDRGDVGLLFGAHQRERVAHGLDAPGAPDAVHVVFR